MEIDVTTPALLFPAISLLLLAYTNRFLTLASLIRSLHKNYKTDPDVMVYEQIRNLRKRAHLIKQMQAAGVISLFLCVLCMFLLFAGQTDPGKYVFGVSILILMWSLILSMREIAISVDALELHLSDIEKPTPSKEGVEKR